MFSFRSNSFSGRLKLVIMTASLLSVLLAAAAFVMYEYTTIRQNLVDDLSTKAQIIGQNCTAALLFANKEDGEHTLQSLQAQSYIRIGAIYDKDGLLFAEYVRPGNPFAPPARLKSEGYQFESNRLQLFQPIYMNNEQVGSIYIESDLEVLKQQFRSYGTIAGLVLIGSLVTAFLLASRLQRSISRPILSLSETARIISHQHDYSVCAQKISNDELGLLADAFNQMLSQIQQRETSLQQTNEAMAREIAERKKVEGRFRLVVESAPNAMLMVNHHGEIVLVNSQAEHFFGYPRKELIGQSIELLVPERYRGNHTGYRVGFMAEPQARAMGVGRDLYGLRKDGSEFPVEIGLNPIETEEGAMVLSSIVDITERKQLDEQLKNKAEELARSNAELEQFAYVASHDLQEPLRMISSFVQLLGQRYKDSLDQDANEFIHFAVDGATRMQTLINDLLKFSRLGTRGKEFVRMKCEPVLSAALINLHAAIEESGATITHDPLPSVYADESQMVQLFQNLIGNAIKFHRENEPPHIRISAQRRNGEYVFSVRDNGIGIETEFFNRIFIIFQRLHDKAKYHGTGIGLAICKKIVEQHGGRIWVESQPGNGSTFCFTIPNKGERLQ